MPLLLVDVITFLPPRSFPYRFVCFSLETPTVVWNSECRHMLGVVLRELEGATPGLQDVPAIEVQEVSVDDFFIFAIFFD